jgi:dolichol-phosphate mannosyltransferase
MFDRLKSSDIRNPFQTDDTPLLSVVVPMFEEQDNISLLSSRLIAVMDNLESTYEVILVDDGSRDATWHEIKQVSTRYQNLKGLRLARNFGHQAALLAGLSKTQGRVIISLDGDLQHPPELIPKMISAWKDGALIVETKRHYNAQTSLFKKYSSEWFYKFFSMISDVKIEEGRSDFRLLDRCALDQMLLFRQSDLFLRGIVGWLDFPSVTIEFEASNRHSGESKYNFKRMLKFARSGILAFSTKPLHIGIGLGLITSVLSFIYLVYIFVQYYLGNTVQGWASTLTVLSFLFGVLFVLLGIIGGYIGRIYLMLQHRPSFIIIDEV